MNDTWDLSVLYHGFESPKAKADFQRIEVTTEKMKTLAEAAETVPHGELIKSYIALEEDLAKTLGALSRYAMLRYSADTADSEAAAMNGILLDKESDVTAARVKLRSAIASFDDLDILCDTDEEIGKFRDLLRRIREEKRYLLTEGEEALFAKMNISGAAAWEDLQSSMTSSASCVFRGEEKTLSEIRNLAYDPDPVVRKEAYDAEIALCRSIGEPVAFALNSIKLQVINECSLRGYEDPLDQALKASRMKKETLDALFTAIREYLPVFRKYLHAKAKLLGYDGGLRWWDLFAPLGKNEKKYTVSEARDMLLSVFGRFDRSMYDLMDTAFRDGWIDFYPREGKVGGAFDESLPTVRQSRILTNFDGSFSDIVTLAHELGHAYHDREVSSHSLICQDYTMPVAETASTFNELLIVSDALERAETNEEKLALLDSRLSDDTQVICDIYSRFLFESAVFENRPTEFMSAERFCGLMKDAQTKAFGDGLDGETLHPYMWLCKSHYYSGDLSFYNFPYAFGGLFARGLLEKYKIEGSAFVPVYRKMLDETPVTDVEECAKIAGINLTAPDFWREGLAGIAGQIEEFCRLAEASCEKV